MARPTEVRHPGRAARRYTERLNKTGWIDDHTHDMAIVRPPKVGSPFALVVLTRLAGVPTDGGDARIAEVAREAWGRRP